MSVCGVYALRDESKAIRYVGASVNIERRFNYHRTDITRPDKLAFAQAADLVVLEECGADQLDARETHWIELLRLLGEPLDLLRSHRPVPALRGRVFDAWLVIEQDGDGATQAERRWLCECSCGTLRSVREATLIRRMSRSCQRHRRVSCRPRNQH